VHRAAKGFCEFAATLKRRSEIEDNRAFCAHHDAASRRLHSLSAPRLGGSEPRVDASELRVSLRVHCVPYPSTCDDGHEHCDDAREHCDGAHQHGYSAHEHGDDARATAKFVNSRMHCAV
jgi:hypothetical protein